MGMTYIETQRLVLRDAMPSDLDAVQANLAQNFEVVGMTGSWIWPADRSFTATRCRPVPLAEGIGGVVLLNGEIIGMAIVYGSGEFGYMFAPAHWGQGYATEIGAALINAAFSTGQWERLSACVFEGNPGSARVLEKLGFNEGARCVSHCTARRTDLPTRNFTLDAPKA